MKSFARQLADPRPFAGRESDETRLASMFVLRGGFATVEAGGLRVLRFVVSDTYQWRNRCSGGQSSELSIHPSMLEKEKHKNERSEME
jgi:hypothetical protein